MKIDPIGRKPDSEERGFLFVGQGINVEFSEWPRVEVQGSSSLKSRYSCLQDKELDGEGLQNPCRLWIVSG